MPNGTASRLLCCFVPVELVRMRSNRKQQLSDRTTIQPFASSGVGQSVQEPPGDLHSKGDRGSSVVGPAGCTAGDASVPLEKTALTAAAAGAKAAVFVVAAVPNPEAAAGLAAALQLKSDATAHRFSEPSKEGRISKIIAFKNAAAGVGAGLAIFALWLLDLASKRSVAVQDYLAAAKAHVASTAASVKPSRMLLATRSFAQRSSKAFIRHSHGAYVSASQLTLGAWLHMLCTLVWVVQVSRHSCYCTTADSTTLICSCVANICVALMACISCRKIQAAGAAAWSGITYTSVTAVALSRQLARSVSTFVCLSVQKSTVCLLLRCGVHLGVGLCLSLVLAMSLVLPSLAFDGLTAGLISSWPSGLVLLLWKVGQTSSIHHPAAAP